MSVVPLAAFSPAASGGDPLASLVRGASIEVMPRTAEKLTGAAIRPAPGTRVYLAHIDGTPFGEMLGAARALAQAGFTVMPHVPARSVPGRAELAEWLAAYRDAAGVTGALVLAGGAPKPRGPFDSSIQLLETGLFEEAGYAELHVAGHPEGNRDIDPRGGTAAVDAALRWKQDYAARTGVAMRVVTQFAFESAPVIAWAERLRADGITLPIRVGAAGPAKLQTLIRYAIACGVGPSLGVLQKRARDVTRLVRPFEPDAYLAGIAAHVRDVPRTLIEGVHLFPLGGVAASLDWLARHGAAGPEGQQPR